MDLDGTDKTPINTADLNCPICMSIADDPQITSCCHRVFCKKDADPRQYHHVCPLCRQRHFSFQSSDKHREMLDQLTIKCVCSERIPPDQYENHLERCSGVTFLCPHSICREKNNLTKYNSEEFVNHLAGSHCNEVHLYGSTYVNKISIDPYRAAATKYDNLVSTVYSVLYPKMIHAQSKNTSPVFKCSHGHRLIAADPTKRKRKDGTSYSSDGYDCDICRQSFSNGQSWHCSCTDSGFDKCDTCLVSQLYNIDNKTLKLASRDLERQQARQRREEIQNLEEIPRGLIRLLTETMNDDETDDLDSLVLRQRTEISARNHSNQEEEDNEQNLRED